MPYDQWTAPRGKGHHAPMPSRSLPLIPAHATGPAGPARANTTFTPIPMHPEFLRNLESHPMIIQRARAEVPQDENDNEDSDSDRSFVRTPSPGSSIEFVHHTSRRAPQDQEPIDKFPFNVPPPPPLPMPMSMPMHAQAQPMPAQVPFPMGSGFSTPVLCASPRPMRGIGSATPGTASPYHSVRSMPSTDSSPARTPDSFQGGGGAVLSPSMVRAIAHAHVQPAKAALGLGGVPPPPPLPLPLPLRRLR